MAARLPVPGEDSGTWGTILNDFLEVSLNGDGVIQTSAVQAAGAVTSINGISPSSGALAFATGNLSDVTISSPGNNQVLVYDSGIGKWTNQTPPSAPVSSVFGRTGAVTAQSGDYSAGQVTGALQASNNLSDVSSASSARTNLGLGTAAIENVDSTASDIQPLGVQAAGSVGKVADAGHVHTMPRLDQVNNPTASVSLNTQKITNLANGSAGSDAAAFGQIPVIDATASDIAAPGIRAAGSTGKAADAGHIHSFAAWQPSDQGLLTWNMDPGNYGSASALATAGTLYVMAVKLAVAASVTNIFMYVGTVGSGLTSGQCFASLYQGVGGALLGTSSDQSGAWVSTGLKTMAISGGPVSAAAGIVYVAVWFNGTTGPAFSRGDSVTSKINVGLAAANSRWGTANTGVTTTAPSTLGTISASTFAYWTALN